MSNVSVKFQKNSRGCVLLNYNYIENLSLKSQFRWIGLLTLKNNANRAIQFAKFVEDDD